MRKGTKKNYGRGERIARIIKVLIEEGPQSFPELRKKFPNVSEDTIQRDVGTLKRAGLVVESKESRVVDGRRTRKLFAFYLERQANIKEALDEFHRNRVSELSWEDLENHPKVHKILTTDERSFALHLASSMDPPIKMTSAETKRRPIGVISYDGGFPV